jgi:hypothetical protein
MPAGCCNTRKVVYAANSGMWCDVVLVLDDPIYLAAMMHDASSHTTLFSTAATMFLLLSVQTAELPRERNRYSADI